MTFHKALLKSHAGRAPEEEAQELAELRKLGITGKPPIDGPGSPPTAAEKGPPEYTDGEALHTTFKAFAEFGQEETAVDEIEENAALHEKLLTIDKHNFERLCRDCKLIDMHYTRVDADVVYAKSKRGINMTFPEFEAVLELVAKKKLVETSVRPE